MNEQVKVTYVGPPGDALVVQMPDSSWRSHNGELTTSAEHADDLIASGEWAIDTKKQGGKSDGGS
jgi:hypothetical protein